MMRKPLFFFLFCIVFFSCASSKEKGIALGFVQNDFFSENYLGVDKVLASEPEIMRNSASIPYMTRQLNLLQRQLSSLFMDIRKKNILKSGEDLYDYIASAVLDSEYYPKVVDSFRNVFEIYNMWVDSMNNIGHLPRNTLRNVMIPENLDVILTDIIYQADKLAARGEFRQK